MYKRDTGLRAQSAFSLIEAAIVLGIIGLVLGGIWVASSAVMKKVRVNQLVNDISVSVFEIQKAYKQTLGDPSGPYSNTLIDDAVIAMKILPPDFTGYNPIRIPYGGTISFNIENFSDRWHLRIDAVTPTADLCIRTSVRLIADNPFKTMTEFYYTTNGVGAGWMGGYPGAQQVLNNAISSCFGGTQITVKYTL